MISQAVVESIQRLVSPENIKCGEMLKHHTTFRVGGAADCMVWIQSVEQLQQVIVCLRQAEQPCFVLGNGSNLLVSDEGYPGVILKLDRHMSRVTVDGCRIRAQAGATLTKVARIALEHGLTGLEFASGIPGTVGGGVIMNAGAYDGELRQVVQTVEAVDMEGRLLTLDNAAMQFGYRTSALKNGRYVITACEFLLEPGDPQVIRAKMDDFACRRREKQPLEYPSAGSTFKRPTGYFAGKLIEDAGLKGLQVGGARVSEKHSGFVINAGEATAADIRQLIRQVQEEVYRQYEVQLEPEVLFLGEFK